MVWDEPIRVEFNGIGNDSYLSIPARGGLDNTPKGNTSNTFKEDVTITALAYSENSLPKKWKKRSKNTLQNAKKKRHSQ